MAILVAAVFQDRDSAREAVESLRRAGFGDQDVTELYSSERSVLHVRPEGTVLVVNASVAADVELTIDLLRESGACFVERDHGEWEDGRWIDFDPARPPERVEIDLRRAPHARH